MASEVWAWQGGTPAYEVARCATMGPDGSSIVAGVTDGNWSATNAGGYDSVAVKLDADGMVLWEWQNGTAADDEFEAVAADRDGSTVLAGGNEQGFLVVKLDADGGPLWQFQDGTGNYNESAEGVAIAGDGSVVVVGFTEGSWASDNRGGSAYSAPPKDLAAFKLDANGTLMWKWQGGTNETEALNAVAIAEDGTVVMAGYERFDFYRSFVAVSLDSEGNELWTWQDGSGIDSQDEFKGIAATGNGSAVLVGYTSGNWSGENAGSGGSSDFAAVKLDVDGNEVWRYQDGTEDYENFEDVAMLDDGTLLIAGKTDGTWSANWTGDERPSAAAVLLSKDGNEISRWQSEPALPRSPAMAAGANGRIVVGAGISKIWGGDTDDAEEFISNDDFLAVMFDTGESATRSPALTPAPFLPSSDTVASSLDDTPAPSVSTTAASASNTAAPSASDTVVPSPDSTPAPSVGTAAFSMEEEPSSNDTPIIAGVASAVAGIILIGLGVFSILRTRPITTALRTRPVTSK